MSKQNRKYNTICKIAIENLNIPYEEFLKKLEKENSQYTEPYMLYDIIRNDNNQSIKISLKIVKGFFDRFCNFAYNYSQAKDWEFSKIIGIEFKK